MKNKIIILSMLFTLFGTLGACSTSPYYFNGNEVVYKTDAVLVRKQVISKDAAKRCASVNKKAVYASRSCVPGGDCTTTYKCK